MHFRSVIALTLLTIVSFQPDLRSQEVDTTISKIKVKNADNFIAERKEGEDHQILRGNVKMFHDSIYMYADSTYIVGDEMTSVGEVIIIQEDTINVFCDSIFYDAEIKLAKLYYNVVLESSDRALFTERLDYDLDKKKATFQDTAIMRKGTMQLSSLRGIYDLDTKKAKFIEEVVIIDGNFKLTTDSLDYDTDIDRAYFNGPTYIVENGRNIYCEDGYYDLEQSKAFLTGNTYIKEDDRTILADNIDYVGADSLIVLEGNVSIKDSTSLTRGNKIIMHQDKDEVEIIGSAYYRENDNVITGPYIKYNDITEDVYCKGRTTILAEDGILYADTIEYTKQNDSGLALGNVIYLDTEEDRSIRSERLFYKEKEGYYRAEKNGQRPVFQQLVDGDTLYLSADTLISVHKENDTLNHILAVDAVRIFKSDLQAKCDSLYYSEKDSVFMLFQAPVCWSDSTSIKGDSILIQLQNEKVSDIESIDNAWIITEHQSGYYDQIKGKHIHSYMKNDELEKMVVKGNAESIYMIKDDDEAYVGPNKTICSHMTFFFENEELDNIRFYTEPDSQMTPMDKTSQQHLHLEGFLWDDSQRPQDCLSIRLPQIGRPVHVGKEIDEFESAILDVSTGPAIPASPKKPEKSGLFNRSKQSE